MKRLAIGLFTVWLGACIPPGTSVPPEASEVFDGGELVGLSEFTQAITFPFVPKPRGPLYSYGQFVEGTVLFKDQFDYALADGYPDTISIDNTAPSQVIGVDCDDGEGEIEWASVSTLDGDAALIRVESNLLTIELRSPGLTQATLSGQLKNIHCKNAGTVVTAFPISHQLRVNVRPIASFVVSSGTLSAPRLIIPVGARVTRPMVMPIDDAGNTFGANNAILNGQAGLTVSAPGGIARGDPAGDEVVFRRGLVHVQVNVPQPVQGLASLEVVGPEAISAFQESFHVTFRPHGASFEPFEPEQGQTYVVPGLPLLKMKHELIEASGIKLTRPPPLSWFRFESMTPSVCKPRADDDRFEEIRIADFVNSGMCHFIVTVPGTSWRWENRFEIKLSTEP